VIFIIPQPQVAHGLHLLADRVGIDAEQVVSAAAKLRRHMYIAVAVEDSLLHVQLVGIRIKHECSTGEVNCVMVRSSILSLEHSIYKPTRKKEAEYTFITRLCPAMARVATLTVICEA
jgi:hypothetical protein